MPVKSIEAAVPELVKCLSPQGIEDLAQAIMTTDTIPKVISKTGEADGRPYVITGVAKGSGMIAPDMATMLCFICTDVQTDPAWLQDTLSQSVNDSLNRIIIDGDMSTNDTVLLMANGLSGVTIDTAEKKASFRKYLDALLCEMAKVLVKDGEGATKLVEIVVEDAPTDEAAMRIAETVAGSSLVKTAIFGEDANWGRIMAAVGRAQVPIDPDRIDIYFDDVHMVKNGMGCGKAAEAAATKVLRKPEFLIRIKLDQGSGRTSVITCDLSVDYVKINADYRS
jgi:glutamate N-acetyltransferase/amino-acid N-acetyltransferase